MSAEREKKPKASGFATMSWWRATDQSWAGRRWTYICRNTRPSSPFQTCRAKVTALPSQTCRAKVTPPRFLFCMHRHTASTLRAEVSMAASLLRAALNSLLGAHSRLRTQLLRCAAQPPCSPAAQQPAAPQSTAQHMATIGGVDWRRSCKPTSVWVFIVLCAATYLFVPLSLCRSALFPKLHLRLHPKRTV